MTVVLDDVDDDREPRRRHADGGEHAGGEEILARLLEGAGPGADDVGPDRLGIDAPVALHHHLLRERALGHGEARHIAAKATAAVLADLRRRFVVVDIINWPVSVIFVPSGSSPQGRRQSPQPYRLEPLVQSFPAVANGGSSTRVAFLPGVASVSRPRARKCSDKVNNIVPSGEEHQHHHDGEADPEADLLGPVAERPAPDGFDA